MQYVCDLSLYSCLVWKPADPFCLSVSLSVHPTFRSASDITLLTVTVLLYGQDSLFIYGDPWCHPFYTHIWPCPYMNAPYMAKTEFNCKSRLPVLTIITWISIYEDHTTGHVKPWISIHGDDWFISICGADLYNWPHGYGYNWPVLTSQWWLDQLSRRVCMSPFIARSLPTLRMSYWW